MKKNGFIQCEAEFQKVPKVAERHISYRLLPGWKGNKAASERFQSSLFLVLCFQQFDAGNRLVLISFFDALEKKNKLQLGSTAILRKGYKYGIYLLFTYYSWSYLFTPSSSILPKRFSKGPWVCRTCWRSGLFAACLLVVLVCRRISCNVRWPYCTALNWKQHVHPQMSAFRSHAEHVWCSSSHRSRLFDLLSVWCGYMEARVFWALFLPYALQNAQLCVSLSWTWSSLTCQMKCFPYPLDFIPQSMQEKESVESVRKGRPFKKWKVIGQTFCPPRSKQTNQISPLLFSHITVLPIGSKHDTVFRTTVFH